MWMRPITIATACLALATEAFLLPPGALSNAPVTDEPTFNALPFEVRPSTELQSVKMDCHGCDLKVLGHTGGVHIKHDTNHFDLNFRIDHAVSGDRLLVNGFELYPESDPIATPLHAYVVPDFERDNAEDTEASRRPFSMAVASQDLGFSLMVRTAKSRDESGAELVSVDLQVIQVGDRFIQGLDNVHLDLIKDKGGALMIGRALKTESQNPKEPQAECSTVACKWRAALASYLKQMKPHHCGHKMGGHGMHHSGSKMAPSTFGGHHHHHHHHNAAANDGQIQYHHTHRSWARLFKQLSYSIVLPILIGIVAGITVSLIGMVVGTLIVGLWRVFVRGQSFFPRRCHRRRSGSASQHKAAGNEAALAEEKSGLMAEQDAPPMYTDEDNKPASA